MIHRNDVQIQVARLINVSHPRGSVTKRPKVSRKWVAFSRVAEIRTIMVVVRPLPIPLHGIMTRMVVRATPVLRQQQRLPFICLMSPPSIPCHDRSTMHFLSRPRREHDGFIASCLCTIARRNSNEAVADENIKQRQQSLRMCPYFQKNFQFSTASNCANFGCRIFVRLYWTCSVPMKIFSSESDANRLQTSALPIS